MTTVRRPGTRLVTAALMLTALVLAGLLPATGATPAGAAPAKDPVIVVGGLFEPDLVLGPLTGRLAADGYRTYKFALPTLGTQDISKSAASLKTKVEEVLRQTGASKVDLVAHSEGGLVSRTYIKNLGGATKVDSLVMMATPNYGTTVADIAAVLTLGTCVGITACQQMRTGSSFLNGLNAGDDTIGSVAYTSISTKLDEVVIPYSSAFLTATDGNIANVTLQSQCPFRLVEHAAMLVDGTIYSGVRNALRKEPVRMNCWAW